MGSVLIHFYFFALPSPLFKQPFSTIVLDKNQDLLSVKIAADEQWRFPEITFLPEKYKTAVLHFEDEYFYYHLGVNPFSLAKATFSNIKRKGKKRGASTISMQVIRLLAGNPPRTIWEKCKEIYLALSLETHYSKEEILNLYASYAPFGGNIVGIETASQFYYGRTLKDLSWAEASTLAVLPNNPSWIYPGKNNTRLILKRNQLLDKLYSKKIINKTTCELAKQEPLPSEFHSFPHNTPHFLEFCLKKNPTNHLFHSTLDPQIQSLSQEKLQHFISQYRGNFIFNGAILVYDLKKNQLLAYVGNSKVERDKYHENFVDIIQSYRSTGSILKPFLYAAMLDDGQMMPNMLIPDIPMYISGFSPQNFTKTYEGVVPADEALARSLNIPAVFELKAYKYERFYALLQQTGLKSLTKSADHYGLSLILGGAEASLWDVANMYKGMAMSLNHFNENPQHKKYWKEYYSDPEYLHTSPQVKTYINTSPISVGAIWNTVEALSKVNRPESEGQWQDFVNPQKIAWKTGTSFGFRDAWAVGVSSQYLVGVWVGNASGEGRPDLIGVKKAAPILFSIFDFLPKSPWFKMPFSDLEQVKTCAESGAKASEYCNNTEYIYVSKNCGKSNNCNYCRQIFINQKGFQVSSNCYDRNKMIDTSYFVLPPIEEWYYKQQNIHYQKLPEWSSECIHETNEKLLAVVYPENNSKIYIPTNLDGNKSKLVCQATHRNKTSRIFWHFDELYLGETKFPNHQMAIDHLAGKHILTILDENGNEQKIQFELLKKEKD